MTAVTIFVIGVLVTGMTLTAVVLVGVSEAADPAHSRPEDLSDWERALVNRGQAENGTEPEMLD
jgi:hypothetical protein